MSVGRVLVVYDSRFGATRDIAEEISRSIRGVGLGTEVLSVGANPDLENYSAVVLGAPVYSGQLNTGLCDWVNKHADRLELMPTAVFVVGATMREDTPEVRAKLDTVLGQAICDHPNLGSAAPRGYFAGRVDPHKLIPQQRFVMKMAKLPSGDWVDLDVVHKWAIEIACKLVSRVSA
ncbi:MAG: menaquinone-dependent protoporphyrinogen [Actinobacteria bacterium]|nr:MAG: menaquinone-dependent protoporphyrinogen [Actinomycetota bacterium]